MKYLRLFCHGIYYQTLYHYEKVSWGGGGDVIPFSASTPLHLPLRQEYFLCKRMLQTDQLALTGCASAGDCASRITTKAISRSLALQMNYLAHAQRPLGWRTALCGVSWKVYANGRNSQYIACSKPLDNLQICDGRISSAWKWLKTAGLHFSATQCITINVSAAVRQTFSRATDAEMEARVQVWLRNSNRYKTESAKDNDSTLVVDEDRTTDEIGEGSKQE